METNPFVMTDMQLFRTLVNGDAEVMEIVLDYFCEHGNLRFLAILFIMSGVTGGEVWCFWENVCGENYDFFCKVMPSNFSVMNLCGLRLNVWKEIWTKVIQEKGELNIVFEHAPNLEDLYKTYAPKPKTF